MFKTPKTREDAVLYKSPGGWRVFAQRPSRATLAKTIQPNITLREFLRDQPATTTLVILTVIMFAGVVFASTGDFLWLLAGTVMIYLLTAVLCLTWIIVVHAIDFRQSRGLDSPEEYIDLRAIEITGMPELRQQLAVYYCDVAMKEVPAAVISQELGANILIDVIKSQHPDVFPLLRNFYQDVQRITRKPAVDPILQKKIKCLASETAARLIRLHLV